MSIISKIILYIYIRVTFKYFQSADGLRWYWHSFPVVDPRRAEPLAPSTTTGNFLNFIQIFDNFGKIVCCHPPGGSVSPHMGNAGSAPDFATYNMLKSSDYYLFLSVLSIKYNYTILLRCYWLFVHGYKIEFLIGCHWKEDVRTLWSPRK